MCDDVEEVRFFLGFTQWLLCLDKTDVTHCLFMYSYSSSSRSSNRPDELDLPILPEMARDVESSVSEENRKTDKVRFALPDAVII